MLKNCLKNIKKEETRRCLRKNMYFCKSMTVKRCNLNKEYEIIQYNAQEF